LLLLLLLFYTLGINDPDGLGKTRKKIVGVTITPAVINYYYYYYYYYHHHHHSYYNNVSVRTE